MTAAGAVRVGGAAGVGADRVRVLVVAVKSGRYIQSRRGRVAHARPVDVQNLVVGLGVVVDVGELVAADVGKSRAQRRIGIRILDVLVTGQEFDDGDLVGT